MINNDLAFQNKTHNQLWVLFWKVFSEDESFNLLQQWLMLIMNTF